DGQCLDSASSSPRGNQADASPFTHRPSQMNRLSISTSPMVSPDKELLAHSSMNNSYNVDPSLSVIRKDRSSPKDSGSGSLSPGTLSPRRLGSKSFSPQ
ncbi:unnamed protein product, partial [Heterosigma akashiwo]